MSKVKSNLSKLTPKSKAEWFVSHRCGALDLCVGKTFDKAAYGWRPTIGGALVKLPGEGPNHVYATKAEAIKQAQRFKQSCRDFLSGLKSDAAITNNQ